MVQRVKQTKNPSGLWLISSADRLQINRYAAYMKKSKTKRQNNNTSYTVLISVLISHFKTLICSNEKIFLFICLLSISLAFLIFDLIISEKVLKNFPSQSSFNTCRRQGVNLKLGYSSDVPYKAYIIASQMLPQPKSCFLKWNMTS